MEAMGLKTTWLNQAPKEKEKRKGIFFHSSQFNNIASVQVLGYERNALNRIWPQMIFGTLLVLLTATSFLIAYRSIRSQQKLNRLREDFISNISHELKTPLSTAKVTIEALKTFDDQKRAAVMHEYLDIADNELERLDELVTKVLHTGMLENENGFIRQRETDLTTLVQEVITAFRARTRDKKADINFEPKAPLILPIDPLHIQGVLYNLLDNALKYNQDENPRINIEIEENENEVLLKVSDNGPGIPADYRDKVFDKFFRVPSGDVHNVKGHGLGLSYTRQVMLKHGGKVMVQNNSPQGSISTLYFSKKA
jgi:two-component system phosphate regulon sensor histidine kinase PhoR